MKNTLFILSVISVLLHAGAFAQGFVADPGTKITVEQGTILDIGSGNLVLNASGQNGASLIDLGTITYSGGGFAEVEIYINEGQWHLISSPVGNEVSGIFLDDYLQYHTESSNGWTDIVPVNIPLVPMQGYGLWSVEPIPGSETISGITNTGSMQFAFSHSGLGWNLIGNPYPSVIDWDEVNIPVELSAAIWLFDPSTGAFGDYRYYIPGGGPANTTSQFIQPGQGFFVRATGSSGTLALDNDVRVHSNSAFYKDGEFPEMLLLKTRGNGITTQTAVRFDDNSTKMFDRLYDVSRIMPDSPDIPVIFSGSTHDPLAINTLPDIEENKTIPIWFRAGTEGTYSISGELTESLDPAVPVWLEDIASGSLQNLRSSPEYTFSYHHAGTDKPFLIHFI